jgi:hypothetical protein
VHDGLATLFNAGLADRCKAGVSKPVHSAAVPELISSVRRQCTMLDAGECATTSLCAAGAVGWRDSIARRYAPACSIISRYDIIRSGRKFLLAALNEGEFSKRCDILRPGNDVSPIFPAI